MLRGPSSFKWVSVDPGFCLTYIRLGLCVRVVWVILFVKTAKANLKQDSSFYKDLYVYSAICQCKVPSFSERNLVLPNSQDRHTEG